MEDKVGRRSKLVYLNPGSYYLLINSNVTGDYPSYSASISRVTGSDVYYSPRPENLRISVLDSNNDRNLQAWWDHIPIKSGYQVEIVMDSKVYGPYDNFELNSKVINVPVGVSSVSVRVRGFFRGDGTTEINAEPTEIGILYYTEWSEGIEQSWANEFTGQVETGMTTQDAAGADVEKVAESIIYAIGNEEAAGETSSYVPAIICGLLALGIAAALFIVTGGTSTSMVLASGVGFLVWAGTGFYFFSVHPGLAFGPAVLVLFAGGISVIRKGS